MLFLNALNPFNFRETVFTFPPRFNAANSKHSKEELYYPLTVQFGVYRFALI